MRTTGSAISTMTVLMMIARITFRTRDVNRISFALFLLFSPRRRATRAEFEMFSAMNIASAMNFG